MKRYDKISTYFKDNLNIVIPMCITALLFDGLMCLIPILEGLTINSLYLNDSNLARKYVIYFISLVTFVQINRFFKRYLVRIFGNKITLKMRSVSLNNLFQKDIGYFISNNAGDILNRNITDIYDTSEGIRKMTTECFDTLVLLIGYIISMILVDYQITLIVLLFAALSIIFSHFMKKKVYKTNKEYKKYLSINKNITITQLNNELYYRGLGVNDNYFEKYEESVLTLKKKNTKALLYKGSLEPLYSAVALLGVFPIILIGGYKVIDSIYEIGILSAYLTTYLLVAKKASKVGKLFNAYQGFKISWERCRKYLSIEERDAQNIILSDEKLVLSDFSFHYSDFKIPNINITASTGDVIGICGKVHSGKSTVLKALTGIYGYDGSAKLGGYEIIDLIKTNEQYISFCSNNKSLFSDTIRNNIELNKNGDLASAIKISRLDADLDRLGGLDSMISHTNLNISGGQQKRIQLARSWFPKTKLLLLDDPFRSVSPNMAIDIINLIIENNNKIIFLVSNDKNILKKCNKIIFLSDSTIIGDYEGLLNREDFKEMMEV
ncbi:MAG: ABC transporter transmembrane domain-containing protein [Anaeroplasma sp.]